MAAVRIRYPSIVTELLRRGADPNAATIDGQTAFMDAAKYPPKDYTGIAAQLLAAGADPNAQNAAGQTALMLAARHASSMMVQFLVGKGLLIDLYLTDVDGRTALQYAQAVRAEPGLYAEDRLDMERKCAAIAAAERWFDSVIVQIPAMITKAGVRLPKPLLAVVLSFLARRNDA